MQWIDVHEDLPPSGLKCLVICQISSIVSGTIKTILEGTFDPAKGWSNPISNIIVLAWCCPSNFFPSEEQIELLSKKECKITDEDED